MPTPVPPPLEAPGRPMAIAHRGVHDDLPENSLSAILRAVELGAQGIEIDVHATADNVLVVHHDPDLKCAGKISALSYPLLAKHELAPGIFIPRLDVVLDAVGKRALVFIEAKAVGIEMLLLRAVRAAATECAVHSLDAPTVRNLKLFMPAVRIGLLTRGSGEKALRALHTTGADDLWHAAADIDEPLIGAAHRSGKTVMAWTANSPRQWRRLEQLGVDGICTDKLARLKAYVR